MVILGIETSCDETAASIISADSDSVNILSNIVSSQVKLHAAWGGVVPNLAAREHLKNIISVLNTCFSKARLTPSAVDLITVTKGPGLIPALLIGVNAAKTLSYVWKKPLLGIHHIEGHIYANFIGNEVRAISNFHPSASGPTSKKSQSTGIDKIKFPVLCLVVSGGHTQLVLMKAHLNYSIIGETLDDAAGEAFDKVARILGLGYPGGPAVSKMARRYEPRAMGRKPTLPRPMIKSQNLNFSFSGLKTAVLYETKKHPELAKNKNYASAMCHEFQQAVIDVLIHKTIMAAKKFNPKTVMLAGGVSANLELRKQLEEAVKKNFPYTGYQIPDAEYSLDNAAMIATAGYFRYVRSEKENILKSQWKHLEAASNLKIK